LLKGKRALTANGWRTKVVDYIHAEARPEDKFGHQPRVYALAGQLGSGLDFDDDVLFAAAWLHDVGVFVGHRPEDAELLKRWNHVPYTVALARQVLVDWGFPVDKLDKVQMAIESHQPQDDPQLLEAVLLRDADILEQLGAVGLLRSVVKVGRDTRYATYTDVLPVLRRAVNELPLRLRLNQARALAAKRVEFLSLFLQAIEAEAGELLH